MAHYIGNKIGVSKDVGILDLYSVNVNGKADGAYVGFPGSQYSLQEGNQELGGDHVVGGFETDPTDGLSVQRGITTTVREELSTTTWIFSLVEVVQVTLVETRSRRNQILPSTTEVNSHNTRTYTQETQPFLGWVFCFTKNCYLMNVYKHLE